MPYFGRSGLLLERHKSNIPQSCPLIFSCHLIILLNLFKINSLAFNNSVVMG